VFKEVLEAGRDVLRITFVEPVKEGRPRPKDWPGGLRQIAATAVIVLAALGLAILGSSWLRSHDELVLSPSIVDMTIPSLALPLLMLGVLTSLALAVTAALHTSWWLRIALLALAGVAVVLMNPLALQAPLALLLAAGSYFALLIFAIVRAKRSYAWWEYLVVLGLLATAMVLPFALPTPTVSAGDARPAAVVSTLSTLQVLMLPAVMAAGFAPAQIVVTGAEAIANRPVSRGLFWTVFGLGVAALGWSTYQNLASGPAPTLADLAGSVGLLALVALAVAGLLRRARASRPPAPAEYPQAWSDWIYPVAIGIAGILIVTNVIMAVAVLVEVLGLVDVANTIVAASQSVLGPNLGTVWRGLVGLVAFVVAWRLATRNRLVEAIILATFAVLPLSAVLGMAPSLDFLQQSPPLAMGLVAVTIALSATVIHLVRGQFDRRRATGVLTVLLLAALFPYRNALSDPISTALAVAPTALLIFGLGWRIFTEAGVTYGSSRHYPQPTRVLLFLANSLLAATGVALVTLSRGMGTEADTSTWAGVGDLMLGKPLYVAGLVAGLWLILRPREVGEVSEQLTEERYDSAEAALADEAIGAGEIMPGWPVNTNSPINPQQ
jgi:hypothetical protein